MSSRQSGFTLIELIIVIGVIGVLSAALLIAINPIEQLNRAKDAAAISDAAQLYRAALATDAALGQVAVADASYGGQQPIVNNGDLKAIIRDGLGGPVYYTLPISAWVAAGDFEVSTGWLASRSSLQAAKAQSDAVAENCGAGSTTAQRYAYFNSGGTWHYWCDHP